MIQIMISFPQITFLPIDSIRIDVVAVVYDFMLALFTGYLVWYRTDEFMLRRDERNKFIEEQQAYSRYLGVLNTKIKSFDPENDAQRIDIEEWIENEPIRVAFLPSNKEISDVFLHLHELFNEIQAFISSKDNHYVDLMKISREISNCRRMLLLYRIEQPRVKFWKVWGKYTLASNSRA